MWSSYPISRTDSFLLLLFFNIYNFSACFSWVLNHVSSEEDVGFLIVMFKCCKRWTEVKCEYSFYGTI